MAHSDHDLLICGAGPVGTALALLLVQQGWDAHRITLVDAKTAAHATSDPRSIALSYGSRQILEAIGAWPAGIDAIEQIHVSRQRRLGRTLIRCADYRLPALGYVTRYGALMSALEKRRSDAGIGSIRPLRIASMRETADRVFLESEDGQTLDAAWTIQAEGGLFDTVPSAPSALQRRDYMQTALIAEVRCSAPIAGRAFERFTNEGPLALLPQEGGYALVWCMRPENAQRLQQADDATFLAALQQAFGMRVGRFLSMGPRHAYALGMRAGMLKTARTVAIGNAAQILHPVAGQGLNLGLRDAALLSRTLTHDPSPSAFSHFLERQQRDRALAIRLTDTMARVFGASTENSPTQTLLAASLGLLDVLTPAKRLLAEQMMFGQR